MTDTAAPPAAAPPAVAPSAEAPPAKGGRKKTILIVVAAVLVAGGAAKFTVLTPAVDPNAPTTTLPGGELVAVEKMNVNLADGRYLQIGVAIELAQGTVAKEFEKKGKPSKMRDLVITTASALTVAQLSTPEGRDALKEQLRAGGRELYHEDFHDVYLTDLVMQ
jgi:flagellar protein FliL